MTFTLKQLSALACTVTLATFTGLSFAQHDQRDQHDQRNQHDQRDQQDHHDGHFGGSDRGRFQQHYQADAHRWAGRKGRPSFEQGHAIPRNYRIQPVPRSYWGGTPPPRGYTYGYYDGYVVSYNPATRIIADVLDLATGH